MGFDIPRVVNDVRSRGPALVGIALYLGNKRGFITASLQGHVCQCDPPRIMIWKVPFKWFATIRLIFNQDTNRSCGN